MAKILVADDEELIRRLIGDCLKKEGHGFIRMPSRLKESSVLTIPVPRFKSVSMRCISTLSENGFVT